MQPKGQCLDAHKIEKVDLYSYDVLISGNGVQSWFRVDLRDDLPFSIVNYELDEERVF
jgi:hypothetical protein